MPRRVEATRKAGIEAIVQQAELPEIIRVRTRFIEVERHQRGYGVVEHDPEPDLDLLLHTGVGERMIRELPEDMRGRRRFEPNLCESTGEYDELAQDADLDLVVDIKGTAQTLEIIGSVAPTITLARGGARSLKTHSGSYWSFRQWMLRGSSSGLGWFIGPEMSVAHVLKDKWVHGEGAGVPPVCPPELILKYPEDVYATDQHIYMVDGFRIRMVHTKAQGKNMPGRSVDFWQWTESAVDDASKSYTRARGRIVTSKGAGYLDAVPEPRNWQRHAITDPALDEDARIADAQKRDEPVPAREYSVHRLDSANNPWNDEKDVQSFRAALEAIDPRLAAREAGGEDIGDANRIFGEIFDAALHTFDFEGWQIPDPRQHHLIHGRPLIDITKQASLRVFNSPHDWIVSVDVNARPHTALIGKVGMPPGLDASNPNNWVAVFLDAFQAWDCDSEEAAQKLEQRYDGRFAGAGVIMDATSCVKGHNAGGAANKAKGYMPREAYEKHGFEVRPPDFYRSSKAKKPRNPAVFSGTILCRRLLRERRAMWSWLRCRAAIRALRDQEDAGDGITPEKRSNTDQDRKIGSWTDCFRYWTWPILAIEEAHTKPVKVRKYA